MVVVMQGTRRRRTRFSTSSPRSSSGTSTCIARPARSRPCSGRSEGTGKFDTGVIEVMDGVQQVLRITEPYKLASRTFRPTSTLVSLGEGSGSAATR